MDKKVYIIAIKESNLLCSTFECYDSFELAKKSIYRAAKNYPDRKVLETNMKNEFDIVDKDCIHIHTLKIIDLWLRTK
jgi:hypothetical protein